MAFLQQADTVLPIVQTSILFEMNISGAGKSYMNSGNDVKRRNDHHSDVRNLSNCN